MNDEQNPIPVAFPLGVYVHVPWCVHKCPYCDFNSYVIDASMIEEMVYLDALAIDLKQESWGMGKGVSTIFVGGGTPSLLSPTGIARLLADIHVQFPILSDAEITMEINPGTVNAAYFTDLKAVGVNRISLGIQSFHDGYLSGLGRIHGRAEAIAAFSMARHAHFDNINLDLMYGLPNQDLKGANTDLVTACALEPEHISYYQLTLEPGTAFYHHPPSLPDEDAQWAMQEQGLTLLADAGYLRYEISAYAKPNQCCRHNLNYWEFGDYLGIGAGAHGKITSSAGVRRRWKLRNPRDYLRGVKNYPSIQNQHVAGDEWVASSDLPVEFMINALRLRNGVPTSLYPQRTGLPVAHIAEKLMAARTHGWLEDREDRLIPTVKGQRFLNDLLELFLPE